MESVNRYASTPLHFLVKGMPRMHFSGVYVMHTLKMPDYCVLGFAEDLGFRIPAFRTMWPTPQIAGIVQCEYGWQAKRLQKLLRLDQGSGKLVHMDNARVWEKLCGAIDTWAAMYPDTFEGVTVIGPCDPTIALWNTALARERTGSVPE